jgi:hypothetical protein
MNIKMDSREADSQDVNWNQLAHYGVQWWAFDIGGVEVSNSTTTACQSVRMFLSGLVSPSVMCS